ncbi:MAG: DUF3108 domain-containing protein [Steroidobacteraceae bacterium]
MRRLATLALLPLAWCVAAPGSAALPDGTTVPGAAAVSPLEPFAAVYSLKWHGIPAGRSTLTLSKDGREEYQYRSVNRARGLFRLAFPDALTETSRFTVAGGHVQPLAYEDTNGPSRAGKDVHLQFDWGQGQVRGTQHGKPVDQPLAAGTQDPLSVQIELMRQLAAGGDPQRFLLFDQDMAKLYDYTRERTERIDTALGPLDTVVYRSDRPGSDRVLTLWLAPSLGFLPVRAERARQGKTDIELDILSVSRP